MSFDVPVFTSAIGFMEYANTLTGGYFWTFIVYLVGIGIFVINRNNEISSGENLILTFFVMTLLSTMLSFAGLVGTVAFAPSFGLFLLTTLLHIMARYL